MIMVQDSEEGGVSGVSRADMGVGRLEGGVSEVTLRGEEQGEGGMSVSFVERE